MSEPRTNRHLALYKSIRQAILDYKAQFFAEKHARSEAEVGISEAGHLRRLVAWIYTTYGGPA